MRSHWAVCFHFSHLVTPTRGMNTCSCCFRYLFLIVALFGQPWFRLFVSVSLVVSSTLHFSANLGFVCLFQCRLLSPLSHFSTTLVVCFLLSPHHCITAPPCARLLACGPPHPPRNKGIEMTQGGNPPNAPRERVRGYLPHRHLLAGLVDVVCAIGRSACWRL